MQSAFVKKKWTKTLLYTKIICFWKNMYYFISLSFPGQYLTPHCVPILSQSGSCENGSISCKKYHLTTSEMQQPLRDVSTQLFLVRVFIPNLQWLTVLLMTHIHNFKKLIRNNQPIPTSQMLLLESHMLD